jgi:hypothetical protein
MVLSSTDGARVKTFAEREDLGYSAAAGITDLCDHEKNHKQNLFYKKNVFFFLQIKKTKVQPNKDN